MLGDRDKGHSEQGPASHRQGWGKQRSSEGSWKPGLAGEAQDAQEGRPSGEGRGGGHSGVGGGHSGAGGGQRGGAATHLFSSTISGSHSMCDGRRNTLMFPKSWASHCSRLSVQPWKPTGRLAVDSAVVPAPWLPAL